MNIIQRTFMFDRLLTRGQYLFFLFLFVTSIFLSGCMVGRSPLTTISVNSITDQQKNNLLSFVYEQGDFPQELSHANNEVVVVLRDQGELLGAAYMRGHSLKQNILLARKNARQSGTIDEEQLEELSIHLHILDGWKDYDAEYLHGADAVMLSSGDNHGIYRGSYAMEENKSEQDLKKTLCSSLGVEESCEMQGASKYLYAPEVHIARDESGTLITFFRGKQLDDDSSFDLQEVRAGIERGQQRLIDNLDSEGKFTYVYNPTFATYSTNNNLIRQFMASRVLAEMSQQDESLLPLHQRNLDYIFKTRYHEDERNGRTLYANASKLGSNALLLRALVASPSFDTYASQAEKLAMTLVDAMDAQGAFEPRWIEPTYAYDKDYLLTFYSGEAILALVEYYLKTQQKRRFDAARKAQDFYLDRYVTHIEENYYPAYVPRHTMSLRHMYVLTEDPRYAQAIFTLNDKVIDEMLHTPEKTGPQDLLGRFYNPQFAKYGTPHSASDGIYVEGIAYAYEIARLLNETERQEKYLQAIELGMHNLLNLQYDEMDAYFVEHPERVIGALRFHATDNRIRTDTTQHAVDAMMKIEQLLSD